MNYELAERAKKHIDKVSAQYKEDIKFSIEHSKVYGSEYTKPVNSDNVPAVKLLDKTTSDALLDLSEDKDNKTVILNFASYINPGGGFLKGSIAQEESLCHCSTLYSVLIKLNDYYEYNRNHKNYSFYTNRAIYSPSIVFIYPNTIRKVNVLTCAAPNWKAAMRHCGQNSVSDWKKKNLDILRDRTQFIQAILQEQGTERVILGAWGCGVFQQDPKQVATAFKCFIKVPEVVLAIPYSGSKPYNTFKKVFS